MNAADRKQTEALRRIQKRLAATELSDMRVVLRTPEGRRTLWRFLTHCSVFASIYDSSSKIYANAARQDVGHFILASINEADESAFLLMMKEAKDGEKRVAAETASVLLTAENEAKSEDQ